MRLRGGLRSSHSSVPVPDSSSRGEFDVQVCVLENQRRAGSLHRKEARRLGTASQATGPPRVPSTLASAPQFRSSGATRPGFPPRILPARVTERLAPAARRRDSTAQAQRAAAAWAGPEGRGKEGSWPQVPTRCP